MHYPHLVERLHAEAHLGSRHEPYAGVSEVGATEGPRQGPNDPDPT
jgi:cytochrome c oxidase subunit 1